jgi:hypothetical protein
MVILPGVNITLEFKLTLLHPYALEVAKLAIFAVLLTLMD